MFHTHKSQSALEYMMTYGWAILIIVIVAAVLYSFGIFSPSSSVSVTVTGFAGFNVETNCVAGGTLVMSLNNGIGYLIDLHNATIHLSNGSSLSEPMDYYLAPGDSHTFFFQNACPDITGTYYNDRISINGTESNALNSLYIISGSVSGHVGALVPYQVLEVIKTEGFPTANAISPNGYYVWQPDQANGTLSVVNVVSASIINTLSGLPSRSVVFSKNGSQAFVAGNSFNMPNSINYLVSINTSNYKVIGNMSGVCDPQILSLSTDTGILLVPPWNPFKHCGLLAINSSKFSIIDNASMDGFLAWSAVESPNGKYIYLTDSPNDTVSIMNASTYKIIKNISGFVSPDSVVFSLDSQYAYIGNGKYLTTINTSSMQIISNITVTPVNGVSGLTISSNGKYIYASICGENVIPVISTSTEKTIYNITLSGYPSNACMSYASLDLSNNLLYIASASLNLLFVISV
ncbi:YncE family protein [Candidatus Parvarchaeota archaeon]|nr:YncE family protein [Candidatus Parvarchaeota archaeon]